MGLRPRFINLFFPLNFIDSIWDCSVLCSFDALSPAISSLLSSPLSSQKEKHIESSETPHRSWLTAQTSSNPFRNQIVSFYSIVLLKSNSSWQRISRRGEGKSTISCETYLLATRYRNFRIIFPPMFEHQRVCVSVSVRATCVKQLRRNSVSFRTFTSNGCRVTATSDEGYRAVVEERATHIV